MARTAKKAAPAKVEDDDDVEGWEDAVVDADDKDGANLRLRDWRDVERFREMKDLRRLVDDDYGLEEIFHIPVKPRTDLGIPSALRTPAKGQVPGKGAVPAKGAPVLTKGAMPVKGAVPVVKGAVIAKGAAKAVQKEAHKAAAPAPKAHAPAKAAHKPAAKKPAAKAKAKKR